MKPPCRENAPHNEDHYDGKLREQKGRPRLRGRQRFERQHSRKELGGGFKGIRSLSEGRRTPDRTHCLRGRLMAALHERQQIGVDLIRMGCRHSVREARVNL